MNRPSPYRDSKDRIIDFPRPAYYTGDMMYTVVVHKSKYGFDVRCPALPGCCSQGATRKEALDNIKGAISTYLEMVRKETAGSKTVRVSVPA